MAELIRCARGASSICPH